jgi:hypothetical protein
MDRVIIGMDPHMRSATIEARNAREVLRATGTFPTGTAGYRAMLRLAPPTRTRWSWWRCGTAVCVSCPWMTSWWCCAPT